MGPAETESAAGRPRAVPPVRPRRRVLLACAAAAGLLVVLGLWWFTTPAPPALTSADVDQAVQRGLEQAQQEERNTPPDAATAYRTITPSLVTVSALRPGDVAGAAPQAGLGSGVIINEDGAVLTALHVVDGAGQIRVEFADGTTTAARIEDSRAESDVAVLSVDRLPEVVVPAVMAGPPPIGDAVFAVGNPLGLQHSLSAGVVSGTDRGITAERGPALDGLIQFDAAVNPGNSGGPLLNRAGQVVGIVTGLANPARQNFFVGIGFAVPIATAAGGVGGPQQ
jgi:S1-C subfamily serine protease